MGKYETNIEPRLEEIGKWAAEGGTMKEIASNLGVSYSGFRKYAKEHPELMGILVENRTAADRLAIGSFYKRVTGYEQKETVRERIDGKLVVTREVTRHIAPDVEAGKFWLSNRMPEQWKNRQTTDGNLEIKNKLESFEDEP